MMRKFQRSSDKTKRAIIYVGVAFFLLLMIRKSTYEYKMSVLVEDATPHFIWEYVSEFKHMKKLNPTIKDFHILSDNWKGGVWTYSVEYYETLSHWPYTPNVALAHVKCHKNSKKQYIIESTHVTCMFNNFYCLESNGAFVFYSNEDETGTIVKEIVNYQCPTFLSSFCRREVHHQREAIANNLKLEFKTKTSV